MVEVPSIVSIETTLMVGGEAPSVVGIEALYSV